MTRIFTYYQPTADIDLVESRRLISLWIDRWAAHGFEPHVLNEHHAARHPYFTEFYAAVSRLPSINPPGYDLACYIRWLAVANQLVRNEIGIMADYDVMPYGWKMQKEKCSRIIIPERSACPCFVIGKAKHFIDMCQRFAAYKVKPEDQYDGRQHISDMYINRWIYEEDKTVMDIRDVVIEYTDKGWETAPLVHYNNHSTVPNGKKPRWQHIPQLRAA